MAGGSGADRPAAGSPCPVIVGPTAVGKTSLVLRLAAEFPIEVVSLDSRQIYRGLRIGTAQPTAAERAACPHALVDFLPPEETYSAQRFRHDFTDSWRAAAARGRLPLLVGGAGLYLRAVAEGFFELPAGGAASLADVRRRIEALDDDALDRRLAQADPVAAARLHPHDRYRRRRALEVHELAGRPLSELAAAQRPRPALGLAFPTVVLERPVADLDRRIARRTDAMLAAGWIAETRALLAVHPPDCPGLRSLGYAQIVGHLAGRLPAADLAPAIVLATRRYAKRQRTWFGRVDAIARGAPDAGDVLDVLRRLVEEGLARLPGR